MVSFVLGTAVQWVVNKVGGDSAPTLCSPGEGRGRGDRVRGTEQLQPVGGQWDPEASSVKSPGERGEEHAAEGPASAWALRWDRAVGTQGISGGRCI